MIALSRIRLDPQTAVYIADQRAQGKPTKEAIRCLKCHLMRWIWRLLTNSNHASNAIFLT